MNNKDRELLARLDEKFNNLWYITYESDDSIAKKIDRLIEGQGRQNGKIQANTIWRKAFFWFLVAIVIPAFGILFKFVLGI